MAEELMIPYPNAGSGHAGNATSRERQEREDASGMTASRQLRTLTTVSEAGADGLTVAELEDFLDVGHGQASSALSHLHRAGKVVRLKHRRNKQELYVVPAFVNGREESPYNPRANRKHPKFYSDATVLKAMAEAGIVNDIRGENYSRIRKFLEALP